MDGLENILYIIIGIGWFALNAYRKSQQAKEKRIAPPKPQPARRHEPQPDRTETADPFRSLEDMILEQLEGQRKPRPEPVIVESASPLNQDKFLNLDLDHSHLSDDYRMSQSESESHRVKRQVEPLKVKEDEREGLMDSLFPEGFDLRKAVVLNAILERPYR